MFPTCPYCSILSCWSGIYVQNEAIDAFHARSIPPLLPRSVYFLLCCLHFSSGTILFLLFFLCVALLTNSRVSKYSLC